LDPPFLTGWWGIIFLDEEFFFVKGEGYILPNSIMMVKAITMNK
jgi:hypothetical protein